MELHSVSYITSLRSPTQQGHHPHVDSPLSDVMGQSLCLFRGQLEDGAEWRMGQEDRGGVPRSGPGQHELVITE